MSSGNCDTFQTICDCFRNNCIWAILEGGLRSCTDSIHGLEGIIDWLDPQECGNVQINCDRFDIYGILIFLGAVLLGLFPGIISTVAVMMRNRGGYRRIGNDAAGDHVGLVQGFLRRIIHWTCCIFHVLLCFVGAVDGAIVDEEHGDNDDNGGGGGGGGGGPPGAGLRENLEQRQRARGFLEDLEDEIDDFPAPEDEQQQQAHQDQEINEDQEGNVRNDRLGNIAGNIPVNIATPPRTAAAAGNNPGTSRASTSRIPRVIARPRRLNPPMPSGSRTDSNRRSSRLAGQPKTNFATLHRRGRGK